MPRQQSWSDQQLIEAVAASTCFKQVCDALGLWPGGTYRTIERHIERLGIDGSHLARRLGPRDVPSRRRWTDEELETAVRESESWSELARRLGYAPSGGSHRYVQAQVLNRRLDTSHFAGLSWAKGRTFPFRPRRELDEVMTERSTYPTAKLKRRVLSTGLLKLLCARCGLTDWQGHPLTLELDHINGNHTDHRLENLRLLCPNCHAQTETYAGRRHRSM